MSRFLDDETVKDLRALEDSFTKDQWKEMSETLPAVRQVVVTLFSYAISKCNPYQKALIEKIGRRWAGGGQL